MLRKDDRGRGLVLAATPGQPASQPASQPAEAEAVSAGSKAWAYFCAAADGGGGSIHILHNVVYYGLHYGPAMDTLLPMFLTLVRTLLTKKYINGNLD